MSNCINVELIKHYWFNSNTALFKIKLMFNSNVSDMYFYGTRNVPTQDEIYNVQLWNFMPLVEFVSEALDLN